MPTERKKIYLIGSLRNPRIPELGSWLRKELAELASASDDAKAPDVEVFDDWYAAGPEADDHWKAYEQARGRTYAEALEGYAARHVFAFDRFHLDSSTHCLLVLPAGKSGHMEIMYAKYAAKAKAAILLDPDDDPRFDVMYQFVDNILEKDEDILPWLVS